MITDWVSHHSLGQPSLTRSHAGQSQAGARRPSSAQETAAGAAASSDSDAGRRRATRQAT